MKKTILTLFVCLLAALILSAPMTIHTKAEQSVYKFDDLIKQEKVKILGRTEPQMATAYWAGNGVEMNINNVGNDILFKIFTTEPQVFFEAFVDGSSIGRIAEPVTPDNTSLKVSGVQKGEHLLRIVRETPTSKDDTAFTFFDEISFDGTINQKPADRELYIEIIGDSYAMGSGVLGTYKYGETYTVRDHSATHSFGYYVAENLNADYSIVAAGGLGLYEMSDEKKENYSGVPTTIQEIYNYTNGVYDYENEGKYDFARKPDIIILRIGANDDSKNEANWTNEFISFIEEIRSKNGNNVPIIYSGTRKNAHFASVLTAIKGKLKDKNVYAVASDIEGLGGAALPTQKSGHPNIAEQQQIANDILKVINDNNLTEYHKNTKDDSEIKPQNKDGKDTKTKDIAVYTAIAVSVIVAGVIIFLLIRKKKKQT